MSQLSRFSHGYCLKPQKQSIPKHFLNSLVCSPELQIREATTLDSDATIVVELAWLTCGALEFVTSLVAVDVSATVKLGLAAGDSCARTAPHHLKNICCSRRLILVPFSNCRHLSGYLIRTGHLSGHRHEDKLHWHSR